ncbi:MAG: holo-ACP synthase [Chloroflexi bacterium]|nr:holo-ACP synthase [Chloroflexota bacterium]
MVIGVDLVEIDRVERVLTRYGHVFLNRVFTLYEVAYCRGRSHELAARFAAKEAVSKALGVGVRLLAPEGIDWHDVEIVSDQLGKPLVALSGRAAARAQDLGLTEWEISLSHSRDNAIAMVVAM